MQIGSQKIGKNKPVYVIAEAETNYSLTFD